MKLHDITIWVAENHKTVDRIGWFILFKPMLWDLFWRGARNAQAIEIHFFPGCVIMLLGALIIKYANKAKKELGD